VIGALLSGLHPTTMATLPSMTEDLDIVDIRSVNGTVPGKTLKDEIIDRLTHGDSNTIKEPGMPDLTWFKSFPTSEHIFAETD
jgi:hypothetical protein